MRKLRYFQDFEDYDDEEDDESQFSTAPTPFEDVDENNVPLDELDEEEQKFPRQRYSNRFSEIFRAAQAEPEGPANSKYRQFLDNELPTRDKPTKMNKLAAVLGGVSEGYFKGAGAGMRVFDETIEEPYRRKVNDFALKEKALQRAAALEDKETGRKASFARSAVQAIRDEELAEYRRKNLARLASNDIVNKAYKEAQAFRLKNPNMRFQNVDGEIRAYNPTDPTKYVRLGEASILGKTAMSQKRAIAEMESALAENRDIRMENIRTVNRRIEGNQDDARQRVLDEEKFDRDSTKPDAREDQARVRLQEVISDPDYIAAIQQSGKNVDDFIEWERLASGQKTGKIIGLKPPKIGDSKAKKVYDVLWKAITGNE